MPRPTAAAAIYGHLPVAKPPEVEQRRTGSLAGAMWPSLAPQLKPPTNPDRDSLLRGLRELNARLREENR